MQEIILTKRKNGMAAMLLIILLYGAAIAGCIFGSMALDTGSAGGIVLFVLSLLYACLGWIPAMGLKVLKPQEALVLTLFGKYIGTLKGDGFYFVNPFCVSVNPAAKTKLSQSGDVKSALSPLQLGGQNVNLTEESANKKISLKIMTLNNNRQKINDCLGNPVEIGIADRGYGQSRIQRRQLQGVSFPAVRQRPAEYRAYLSL